MDNQHFYVVDPAQLRFTSLGDSLQRRRDRLGELVRATGAEWAGLRMRAPDFLASVEELDRFLDADSELTNSTFENSPQEVLPIGSSGAYDPLFGYFDPVRVKRFHRNLNAIPATKIETWEAGANGETMGRVVHAFRSTFAEAAKRGHAVAVEHS
jgi:hypothetical protein